jgi:hypothetical protein
MAESHASYQTYVPQPTEAQMTPAERERQSEQFRQPGKVRFTPGVGVEYVEVESSPVASPAEKAVDWLNSMTDPSGKLVDYFDKGSLKDADIFVQVGEDRITMAAAKAAGVIKRGPSGELINTAAPAVASTAPAAVNPNRPAETANARDANKTQQEQHKQQDAAENAPIKWESPEVDQMVSIYAPLLGESGMQSLVSRAVTTGEGELPDNIAESMSQIAGNTVTPAKVKAAYRTSYEAAVQKANAIVQEQGIEDVGSFYTWLDEHHAGKATEARYAFAEGNGRPLANLAREYVQSHGSGISAADVERLLDPRNTVTGGKIYRAEDGTPTVEINGRQMTLREAVRQGFVRVS